MPFGALPYVLADGPAEVGHSPTTVDPTADGPFLPCGALRIAPVDGEGQWTEEVRMSACACGWTTDRPLCNSVGQEPTSSQD